MSEKSTVDRLVHMANQIADFFRSQGGEDGHAARVLGVADHIRAFWDPRMRRLIFEHLERQDGEGLKPLAREAVELLLQRERTPQAVHAAHDAG